MPKKSLPRDFGPDPYPGGPRVLFVGLAESSHTHCWIDLLKGARINVRMFALPTAHPPDQLQVRTYTTFRSTEHLDPATRVAMPPAEAFAEAGKPRWRPWVRRREALPAPGDPVELWLDRILDSWQPQVVHTLGLDGASYFYLRVRQKFPSARRPCWVAQLRGATDLVMHRLLPEHVPFIDAVLRECDQIIADNHVNYETCRTLGVEQTRLSRLGIVPGSGGLDVGGLTRTWASPPSARPRVILWPKAYECPYSKALPVLEALRLAWPRIQPCSLRLLAVVQSEIRMWVQTLPQGLRDSIELNDRIPQPEVLKHMAQARVMLAPSLSDGIPNCLYEAMACGAFPIVSPLETITPLVQPERNVLFARNLYPQEIAEALVRAMSEDGLVDAAARNNLALVGQVADRTRIGPRAAQYYCELAQARQAA
jgi:glycosyltransferase involved in cell wall biosynthesis